MYLYHLHVIFIYAVYTAGCPIFQSTSFLSVRCNILLLFVAFVLGYSALSTCRHLTCISVATLVVNVNTYRSIVITYSLMYFFLFTYLSCIIINCKLFFYFMSNFSLYFFPYSYLLLSSVCVWSESLYSRHFHLRRRNCTHFPSGIDEAFLILINIRSKMKDIIEQKKVENTFITSNNIIILTIQA